VSKSDSKAFGRLLCSRPKAKIDSFPANQRTAAARNASLFHARRRRPLNSLLPWSEWFLLYRAVRRKERKKERRGPPISDLDID
jgi:hypothetical protein